MQCVYCVIVEERRRSTPYHALSRFHVYFEVVVDSLVYSAAYASGNAGW